MMKHLKKFTAVCLGLLFLSSYAFAMENPAEMLTKIADDLISQLKKQELTLKNNANVVYSIANKIVVPHADMDEMSKRVLPPQIWKTATAAQKSQFKSEFTTLLVRTYASALAEYKDQKIKFYPVRGGYENKSSVQISSDIIRSDGPSIPVSYRLIARNSQWKLYDLSVEGVSLLESFRSQFADQLSQGNMDSLLKQLKRHNEDNAG